MRSGCWFSTQLKTRCAFAVFKGFNVIKQCHIHNGSRAQLLVMAGMFSRGLTIIISHLILLFFANTQRLKAFPGGPLRHLSHVDSSVWAQISVGDGAFVAARHRRLTLQLGLSGSTRSLRLPHLLATLGMRRELMNEDAGSAGGAAELKLELRNHAKDPSGLSSEGGGGRR